MTAKLRESWSETDVAAKDAAEAAGRLAARVAIKAGRAATLSPPDYDDSYLTYLWYLGFGQEVINRGREVGGVNFRRGTDTTVAAKGRGKAKDGAAPERTRW